MPKKITSPAAGAAESRPQILRDGKLKSGFDPAALKGGKGGTPKGVNGSVKRLPVPGKGWGR